MNTDDFNTYWVPAVINMFGEPITSESCRELDKLLGVDHFQKWLNFSPFELERLPPLSREMKTILVGLRGPHAHALLKAWQIKRGIKP